MGKFDDLLPDQMLFLRDLVRVTDPLRYECLWRESYMGSPAIISTFPDGTEVMNPAPRLDTFYFELDRLGYIALTPGKSDFRLTRRAVDFAAYAALSPRQQRRADLIYDLGHDDTVKSKLIWTLGGVVVSVILSILGTISMSLLGWI